MAVRMKWHGRHLNNDRIACRKTNKRMFFGKKSDKIFGFV